MEILTTSLNFFVFVVLVILTVSFIKMMRKNGTKSNCCGGKGDGCCGKGDGNCCNHSEK